MKAVIRSANVSPKRQYRSLASIWSRPCKTAQTRRRGTECRSGPRRRGCRFPIAVSPWFTRSSIRSGARSTCRMARAMDCCCPLSCATTCQCARRRLQRLRHCLAKAQPAFTEDAAARASHRRGGANSERRLASRSDLRDLGVKREQLPGLCRALVRDQAPDGNQPAQANAGRPAGHPGAGVLESGRRSEIRSQISDL